MSKNKHNRSFSIYLANRKRKPGLIRSFLLELEIELGESRIVLNDGSEWPLFKEEELEQKLAHDGYAQALVSFQVFADGEFFAIGRLYQEQEKQEKQEKQNDN
jgi:hypothetical protein